MRKRTFWKRVTATMLAVSIAVPTGMLIRSAVADASAENLVLNGTFDGNSTYNSTGWENVAEAEPVPVTKTYELVENGDFEAGQTSSGNNGWYTNSAASLQVVNESGNENNKVLEIASTGVGVAFFEVSTPTYEIGKTYTISYNVRSTGGSIGFTNYTEGIASGWKSHGWKNANTTWQTVSYDIEAVQNKAWAQVGIQFDGATGDNKLYIDDFSISYAGIDSVTVETDVVQNGDFEAGNTSSGNNGWYTNSAASLQVVDESGNENNKVLEIASTGVGVVFFEVSTPTYETGKTYTVSYSMRSTGANIGFTNYSQNIDSGWKSHGWTQAKTAWQTVSYDITATQSQAWAQVGIQFDGATGADKLYIDDVSIVTTETKTNYEYKDGLVVEDGDYALLMSTMPSAMNTVTGTELTEGQTYDYSFYVKNKETASDFSLKFCADSIKKDALTGAHEAADTWSLITGSFKVTEGGVAKIGFERNGTGEVYIDDLKISEHVPTGNDVVLRFAVVSDMHIDQTQTGVQRANKFAGVISSAYNYANNQPYDELDALVVVGDMVNSGVKAEYDLYNQKLDEEIKSGTEVIEIMGNHEYWGNVDTADVYKQEVSSELNQHVVINGYHFLGISQDNDDSYTSSMDWVEKELDAAAEDSVNKPMFAFQHIGIQNTAYGTYAGGYTKSSEEMDALYSQYSNLIHFSGHTHTPINTPTIISQSDYTQVATGTLYYIAMENDATYGTQPPKANDVSQYYIVEVYGDNRVEMKPYNQLTNSFFKTPSTTDAEDAEIVYTVDVNDKENWLYTASRTEGNNAPYFESDDTITFDKVTYKSAQITFPQAEDDNGVYRYEITCTPESGEAKSYSIFSEYYFEPMVDTLSYRVAGLEEDTEYEVTVTPVDFYGVKGEAIKATLQTVTKSGNEFALSLQQYYVDRHIDLSVSNEDLLTGSYYKIPVTLDGVDGYAAASNNGSYMTIWPEFITVYDKQMTMNESILIEEGAILTEVEAAKWTEIEGGDSVVLDKTLYLEFENGAFVDKTTEYLANSVVDAMNEFVETIVNSANKAAIESLIEEAEELKQDSGLSAGQVASLEDTILMGHTLLERIAAAKEAVETSNIIAATDVTNKNVKLEDKTILESAKKDLQDALAAYGENYTLEEDEAILEMISRINAALVTIDNVEQVIADVAELPEVDKADMEDAKVREAVSNAEDAYDALSCYEKTLVDSDTKAKLEELVEAVNQYEKEHVTATYQITEGANGTYTIGGEAGLTVKANGDFAKFAYVIVDDRKLEASKYEVKEESQLVTLKPSYLDTLSIGKHTITIVFEDGSAGTGFTILEKPAQEGQTTPSDQTSSSDNQQESSGILTGDNGMGSDLEKPAQEGQTTPSDQTSSSDNQQESSGILTGDNGMGIWLVLMVISAIAFAIANFGCCRVSETDEKR